LILPIPTSVSNGNYYLFAYADVKKNVAESNESNNFKYSSTKIKIYGPQFILLDAKIGGDVTRNYQINNYLPKTDFAKTVLRMIKNGSTILKFGNGLGPKVMINAGIHGNEVEANLSIMKYLEYIKDKDINGTLYINPFALPLTTAPNTRNYRGQDPNRVAGNYGTPGWNIVQFARKNGVQYFLDVHSGSGISAKGTLFVTPSSTTSPMYKWAIFTSRSSGCNFIFRKMESGMLRTELTKYNIKALTVEVEKDSIPTTVAATTEYKIINAVAKYFKFPSTI
jgi:predicted deacylase